MKLHPTDASRVSEILQDHLGALVNPPESAERLAELGPFEERTFTVDGTGWTQSSTDIVIAGLGTAPIKK